MEAMKNNYFHVILALLATLSVVSVNGQISMPCTTSVISTFTPCLNFITGSSANGGSAPSQSCCGSLKWLMNTSMDCACLVINANVPVQLPINRTLSLGLPQACNMGGVPIQCKASGSPLPAPGPVILGPSRSPMAASPLSPRASKQAAFAPAPSDEVAPPPEESEALTSPAGIRPVLRPPSSISASLQSYISPPAILLLFLGILTFNGY